MTRTSASLIALLAVSAIAAAQEQLEVSVQKIAENSFRLTLTTQKTSDVAIAQRLLLPKAEALCGDRNVAFGKYKFQSREPLAVPGEKQRDPTLVLQQDIECGTPVNVTVETAKRNPSGWHPSATDERMVIKLTNEYFGAKDTGRIETAYAMFSDANKRAVSFKNWSASVEEFNQKAGKASSRTIKKITWYDNPWDAPLPGFYAAVDFEGKTQNFAVYCGFLIWHRAEDGWYRLMREESGVLPNEIAEKYRNNLDDVKRQLGCR